MTTGTNRWPSHLALDMSRPTSPVGFSPAAPARTSDPSTRALKGQRTLIDPELVHYETHVVEPRPALRSDDGLVRCSFDTGNYRLLVRAGKVRCVLRADPAGPSTTRGSADPTTERGIAEPAGRGWWESIGCRSTALLRSRPGRCPDHLADLQVRRNANDIADGRSEQLRTGRGGDLMSTTVTETEPALPSQSGCR